MDDSPLKTAQEWLEEIERHADHGGDGKWLELLVCDLGPKIIPWDFEKVYLWQDWPGHPEYFPNKSHLDVGIDNVGVRRDGSLVAIQCKAKGKGNHLTKDDVMRFTSAATSTHWVERWIISNASFSAKVKSMLQLDTDRPVKVVDFVNPTRELALRDVRPLREDEELTSMQNEAVNKIVKLLPEHAQNSRPEWNPGESRGHIVMPCGTGKTRVSYRVMMELVQPGEVAVVLVPSIALVSQIKVDYQRLAKRDGIFLRTMAVCSDQTAGRTRSEDSISLDTDRTKDIGFLRTDEVVGETGLNEDQVADWLDRQKGSKDRIVLFSTYQSAHNTAEGLKRNKLIAKLMIGDEAHRTAGIRKVSKSQARHGERIRNFTLCHDKDRFPAKYRLYQTATPRIFTTQAIDETVASKWEVRSMNDEKTFGKELFRLGYKDAVAKNLLSDYKIIAMAMGDEETEVASQVAKELNEQAADDNRKPNWTTGKALRALALAAFLAGALPKVNIKSVIAFCNRIRISEELVKAIRSTPVREWLEDYMQSATPPPPPPSLIS